MTSRTLRALEQLAARPGTEHEGVVAREKLARLKHRGVHADPNEHRHLRMPSLFTCACGSDYPVGRSCTNSQAHEKIRAEVRTRFPKGMRVYYNRWAYKMNDPGIVVGYPRPDDRNWGWIRVKFDKLKSARAVPIYSDKGWHLSGETLGADEAEPLRR